MRKIVIFAIILFSSPSFSFILPNGHLVLQAGGFISTQGKSQFVGINGLIGNNYTLSQNHGSNPLFGLGYYLDGPSCQTVDFSYGIDAFYLPKSYVKGNVIQEEMFNNLDYRYSITYVPIYAGIKAAVNKFSTKYALTFDLGVGADFISTSGFVEHSLDGGFTLPDDAFSGTRKTALSAMAGVGLKVNNVFGSAPLECGYRFFYLGQGQVNKDTSELLGNIITGYAYANALLCSVSI